MIELQHKGALNINLVSPTHVLLPILKALQLAISHGLTIPLVYNTNGYENLEVIRNLNGIVDIYLPDIKYLSPALSQDLSQAPDYFRSASSSLKEMLRQIPELIADSQDNARKGVIIRHLVLPGESEDSINILRWLGQNCGKGIALSLMSQYKPCYQAPPRFQRPLVREEYNHVVNKAIGYGFQTLFFQPEPFAPGEHRDPDFDQENPFDWS
jgi:putative pyruvate formate lyase activating enzyme